MQSSLLAVFCASCSSSAVLGLARRRTSAGRLAGFSGRYSAALQIFITAMEHTHATEAVAAAVAAAPADSTQKQRIPGALAAHLLAKGLSAAQVAQLSRDEALAAAGRITDSKALCATLRSVLRAAESASTATVCAQLEALTGADSSPAQNSLVQLLNCTLAAHGLAPYSGSCAEEDNAELLEEAFVLAAEAEPAAVKMAARLVLARLPLSSALLDSTVQRKAAALLGGEEAAGSADAQRAARVERYVRLFSGSGESKQRLQAHLAAWSDATAVLAARGSNQAGAWAAFAAVHAQISSTLLPPGGLRALGMALLRQLHAPESVAAAAAAYIAHMKKKAFDFAYARPLLQALSRDAARADSRAALARLVIYLLTEKSACGRALCDLGIHAVDAGALLQALEALRPERINLSSSIQVFKQIVRAHKASRAHLAALEALLGAVQRDRPSSIHAGVLAHVRALLGIRAPRKPAQAPCATGDRAEAPAETRTEPGARPDSKADS